MWHLYTAEMLVGKQGASLKPLVKLQHMSSRLLIGLAQGRK
jgi:hypothetical protein